MRDDSTMAYKGDVLDECHQEMQKAVQDLMGYAENLKNNAVKLRTEGHFTGGSADAYINSINEIERNLQGVGNTVGQMGSAMNDGHEEMMAADRRGASGWQ